MALPVESGHIYLSTACLHGLHDKCREWCKYCGNKCVCMVPECHEWNRGRWERLTVPQQRGTV
jgi:hypothetical protein